MKVHLNPNQNENVFQKHREFWSFICVMAVLCMLYILVCVFH